MFHASNLLIQAPNRTLLPQPRPGPSTDGLGLNDQSNHLREFSRQFVETLDIRENSRSTYARSLERFLAFLESRGDTRPRRQSILDFKKALIGEGLGPSTLGSYLTAVRQFFQWLASENLYPNIAEGIRGAKMSQGYRKDLLTGEQCQQLLDSIETETLTGKRDFALLNLLIRTGIRSIEVIRADVGDVRQESGEWVLWVHGKGRDAKDAFVLLTAEALAPLMDYLAARGKPGPEQPLFVSGSNRNPGARLTTRTIRGTVKTRLRRLGLDSDRLTCHSLRHTFATLALKGGAPLEQVQAACRHASIQTTMVYAHNLDRVANGAEKFVKL